MPIATTSPQVRAICEASKTQIVQTFNNCREVLRSLRSRNFPDAGPISPADVIKGYATDGKEVVEAIASLTTHVNAIGPLLDPTFKPLPEFLPFGWTASTAADGTVTLTEAAAPKTKALESAGGTKSLPSPAANEATQTRSLPQPGHPAEPDAAAH